jgi:hypothetical protein
MKKLLLILLTLTALYSKAQIKISELDSVGAGALTDAYYFPVVDPNEGSPSARNKRLSIFRLDQRYPINSDLFNGASQYRFGIVNAAGDGFNFPSTLTYVSGALTQIGTVGISNPTAGALTLSVIENDVTGTDIEVQRWDTQNAQASAQLGLYASDLSVTTPDWTLETGTGQAIIISGDGGNQSISVNDTDINIAGTLDLQNNLIDNVDQINIVAGGSQDVQITAQQNDILVQGGTASTDFIFEIAAQGNDGLDDVGFEVDAVGTVGGGNREDLWLGWDSGNSQFEIRSEAQGSGTARALSLFTSGNAGQLDLNTDGTTSLGGNTDISGDLTLIGGGTGAGVNSKNIFRLESTAGFFDNVRIESEKRGAPSDVSGSLHFYTVVAGLEVEALELPASGGANITGDVDISGDLTVDSGAGGSGSVFGGATGGAQGAGTINAEGLYVDGVAVGSGSVTSSSGSSVDNRLVTFDGTSGEIIQDGTSWVAETSNITHSSGTSLRGGTTNTSGLFLASGANVRIGGASASAGGNYLQIGNGTAPTGGVSNQVWLYAEDVSSSSELKVRDEAGNITVLSDIESGDTSPTPNGDINCTSGTGYLKYTRVGDEVSWSITWPVTTGGLVGNSNFDIPIPISSTFTVARDVIGAGSSSTTNAGNVYATADTGGNEIQINFRTLSTSVSTTIYASGHYIIK